MASPRRFKNCWRGGTAIPEDEFAVQWFLLYTMCGHGESPLHRLMSEMSPKESVMLTKEEITRVSAIVKVRALK
jgi:hypothetical protein